MSGALNFPYGFQLFPFFFITNQFPCTVKSRLINGSNENFMSAAKEANFSNITVS